MGPNTTYTGKRLGGVRRSLEENSCHFLGAEKDAKMFGLPLLVLTVPLHAVWSSNQILLFEFDKEGGRK